MDLKENSMPLTQ